MWYLQQCTIYVLFIYESYSGFKYNKKERDCKMTIIYEDARYSSRLSDNILNGAYRGQILIKIMVLQNKKSTSQYLKGLVTVSLPVMYCT